MAKKRNGRPVLKPAPQNIPGTQKQATSKPLQPAGAGFMQRYANMLIQAGIAIVTWLVYKTSITNKFTNWDDTWYINENALVKDLSLHGLKNIFSTATMGNYHPLTILSYAVEYSYVHLQPWLYHLDSILLHIAATLLVYWFVLLLTRRTVAAAITALLFGLHPVHVESVAWVSGRKDVVYAVFYIAACIAHLYYIRAAGSKKIWWYTGVIVLFLCSLLGKPVAVVLPVTLLLIDYFEKRKWNYRLWAEKAPHFAMSIAFGIKSVLDQRAYGAINYDMVKYTFIDRIALGSYALLTYLWKAFAPFNLCCLYIYPEKVNGSLPVLYFIYPVAAAILIFLVWKFARNNKAIVFGSLFFLSNIFLLLQFLPVGVAIIADRYAYIPYLGLFFIAGWLVSAYFEPGVKKERGYIALSASVVYALFLGYLSNERCMVWHDSVSLWYDEIEKEPLRNPIAYNNLGYEYLNEYKESANQNERKVYYDSSYQLLSTAIEMEPAYQIAYVNLGELERNEGHFPKAKKNYYKALALKAGNQDAYLGLAIIYAINNNLDSSGYCFRMAVKIKPDFPEAHSSFGNYYVMAGKKDSAFIEYSEAIKQKPDMYEPYLNRGRLLQYQHQCGEAMKDFGKALEIKPASGEIYYARSYCYDQSGNIAQALKDIAQAISLGFTQVDNNYYQALKSKKGQ